MTNVCQALAYTRSSERVGEARASSCPKLCRRIGTVAMALPCQSRAKVTDGSYGCAAPKLCGRIETMAEALPCQSRMDISDDSYGCAAPKLYGCVETIAKAVLRQSSEQSSRQAKRP